jgi:cell division protein FtsW
MLTVGLLAAMVLVANRWLLGIPGSQSVQPVELAKYGAIVYIAAWLEAKRDVLRDFNLGLVPFALLLGTLAGMILLERDLSTTVIFVATAAAMFFVAGADLRQLVVLFLFGSAAIVIVVGVLGYNYSERVKPWLQQILHGDLSALNQVGLDQPMQSVRALSKGGWFGIGLGHSEQKFLLYAPHTDCIFAIIGEELGFIGALCLMVLFGVFVWRGLRVALRAPDTFGMLLAIGIVAWVVFQALLHVAVITVTMPFTGTVLPFVSYGGSSLLSGLGAIGILLNISRGGGALRQARS